MGCGGPKVNGKIIKPTPVNSIEEEEEAKTSQEAMAPKKSLQVDEPNLTSSKAEAMISQLTNAAKTDEARNSDSESPRVEPDTVEEKKKTLYFRKEYGDYNS